VEKVASAAKHMEITGIVQGVGFRPFVYNLAVAHGLCGWVRNTSAGVEIEVEGAADALDLFTRQLVSKAPPLARIESITVTDVAPNSYTSFVILQSEPRADAYQLISPDIATCADCLRELFDPQDRRHAYPFTNCTNCGPRFTIIEDIPYDRPKTTMRSFRMCPDCQAEYDNPADRRFHAQPNACPACGPHLRLVQGPVAADALSQDDLIGAERSRGAPFSFSPAAETTGEGFRHSRTDATADLGPVDANERVIQETSHLLKAGAILALKGLGGFHVACDATNDAAVSRLRQLKQRPSKPFAVMMATLDDVRRHCLPSSAETELLVSPASPIVLLPWRDDSTLARAVAPNNRYLGVMLPYTPLHHLLLREVGRPLVMTSGNFSEEPIAKDNDEALQRLGKLADAFLMHNRGIYARYDDSVWFVPLADRPQPVRRARGYAPSPVRTTFPLGSILACGAELKNTFCLTRDRYAFVSQHVGDMENLEALAHFEATVALYERLFRIKPVALACDMHPDYLATRYAQERATSGGLPLVPVQHHHAHIASCLADNDWPPDAGPVIGVAMDGTGYGSDGHIWGGEVLIADYDSFKRFGHLQYMPMPGGEAAIRRPYRLALAYLQSCLGALPGLPFVASVSPTEVDIAQRMVEQSINTPLTSSCGRLFDAVSALLGVCGEASYEGQPAIELEMLAGDVQPTPDSPYPFSVDSGEVRIIRLEALLEAIVRAVQAGRPTPEISAAFHNTVAQMIARLCELAREEKGLNTVALSGGCFQNRQLLRLTVNALQARGFCTLLHRQVSCNDGGLSLGQAMVAHFTSRGNE